MITEQTVDLPPNTNSALKLLVTQRWLLAIVVVSVMLRVGLALYLGNNLTDHRGGTADQVSYDALAQRVVAGYGFSFGEAWWPATRANEPTAHWSYIYTGFLAAVYAVVGHQPVVARLLQAAVTGVLLPWLTWRIGRRTFDERVGLVAAGFVAVYFYYIVFSAALMTEAFYTVALLWMVDAAQRLAQPINASGSLGWARGVELGAAIGVALLLRQVGVFLAIVVGAWLLWYGWQSGAVRRVIAPLSMAVIVCFVFLLPAIVRNYRAFGTVSILPNTNSGFALYWANHPIYGTTFETVLSDEHGVSYYELIPAELRGLNEAQLDQALQQRGVQLILDDPGRYIRLSFSRIPVQFQFWPTADSSLFSNALRLLSFGLAVPFILIGILLYLRESLIRPRGQHLLTLARASGHLLLALIVVYNMLHILTWAKVRYRLPTDAFMLIFAAYVVTVVWSRLGIAQRHGARAESARV